MREKGKNRQNGTNFAVNLALSAKTNYPLVELSQLMNLNNGFGASLKN